MRLTKIVCTLGPASSTQDQIRDLAKIGMSIARFNFSHGSQEDHGGRLDIIENLRKEGWNLATMLDTKGAEIRSGDRSEPLMISKGQEILFSSNLHAGGDLPVVFVNYDGFATDVLETDRILVDNGEIIFDIVKVDSKQGSVVARARNQGKIGSRRHINLPGADVDLPSVTEKDWSDIEFGIKRGMDFVALSFIRTAEEVKEVRAFIQKHKGTMRIISKIETQQSVDNIGAIIDASDGIMVARGDLGAEMPFERIPVIQDHIVEECRKHGKPVIVATHMLESMIEHPTPTRAEVTDISHAVQTRTDATMLSGETANGKNPATALAAMDCIIRETESHLTCMKNGEKKEILELPESNAKAALTMANALGAPAIIVMTHTGRIARSLSRLRPTMPIIAMTDSEIVQRSLQLSYAVHALHIPFEEDPEATIDAALLAAQKNGWIAPGQKVVLVTDLRTHGETVSTVHARQV